MELITKYKRDGLPDKLNNSKDKDKTLNVTSAMNVHVSSKPNSTNSHMHSRSALPSLSVAYTSADTLTSNKLSELKAIIPKIRPHIIAITEVKPKHFKERLNQDFTIDNYTLFPCSLEPSNDRGIIIYVHETLNKAVSQVTTLVTVSEISLLEIRLRGGDRLLLGCVYRSPTAPDIINVAINKLIYTICNGPYSHICLLGDFNAPHIIWDLQTTSESDHSFESKFIQTAQDCFLYQHVDHPTRSRGTVISDLQYLAPLGASDHALLTFQFHCYSETNPQKKKIFLYNRGDYNAMRTALTRREWANNIEEATRHLDTEATWKLIKEKILELREEFIPTAIIGDKPNWKYEFPISDELKINKDENKACRKWNINRLQGNVETYRLEYVRLRNRCQ